MPVCQACVVLAWIQPHAIAEALCWAQCRYGWFVMVVEMLGATATMLYGLNIVMDPVHEELEMEPDAPGITKVANAPQQAFLGSLKCHADDQPVLGVLTSSHPESGPSSPRFGGMHWPAAM